MPAQLEEYETDDIYLAAYFSIAGCELARRRKQGPKVWFVFTNIGGSMKELRDAFYIGKAQGSYYSYSQKVIAMKQLCFD